MRPRLRLNRTADGRIDLGLGRAPGTDQLTLRALRRDYGSADSFPQDVLELQAFLAPGGEVGGMDHETIDAACANAGEAFRQVMEPTLDWFGRYLPAR